MAKEVTAPIPHSVAEDALDKPLYVAPTNPSQRVKPNNSTITLVQRLHAVMSEVTFIPKDKTNQFHKYRYASEQAIKETLHPQLVKHGIMFMTSITDVKHEHGNDQTLTTIMVHYQFIDVATGEKIEGTFAGSGMDNSEKGLYKAITGCLKYLLTSTFLIPTGDDPEDDANGPTNDRNSSKAASRGFQPPATPQNAPTGNVVRLISDNQGKRLWAIARSAGWDDEALKAHLMKHGLNATKDIPLSMYDKIVTEVEGGTNA